MKYVNMLIRALTWLALGYLIRERVALIDRIRENAKMAAVPTPVVLPPTPEDIRPVYDAVYLPVPQAHSTEGAVEGPPPQLELEDTWSRGGAVPQRAKQRKPPFRYREIGKNVALFFGLLLVGLVLGTLVSVAASSL